MVSELFEDICGIREFTFRASLHKKIIWCSISKLKDKELVEIMRRPVKIGSWMMGISNVMNWVDDLVSGLKKEVSKQSNGNGSMKQKQNNICGLLN